jgi:hypothetical protein
MKAYGEWIYRSRFLDLATSWGGGGVRGQLYAPAALPPGIQWIRGWVDRKAGLDDMQN